MRADILEIYEASIRARQKFDADQKRFGPELQPQRSREPRQTEPLSELAKLLAFLRTYRTDDPPAGPVTIFYQNGKPYEITDAAKVRAAEEARTQSELEEFWSTREKIFLRVEIEHATAKRKNRAEDVLRRYGILVNGEIDWSTYVHALRKVGKPLKDFLKPVFDLEAENNTRPGKQPTAYIADLAEMIDLVESKAKKRPGPWRRAQSLDLRADRLSGLPDWLRNLRAEELKLSEQIDAITRLRLCAPDKTVQAGTCFCLWHGILIPHYPELRDFYDESCRPRRYCALSRRPKLVNGLREKHVLALAAAKRNREMVQLHERASYFMGDEAHPKRKARCVQDRGTLGNEKEDTAELDEILRIAKSEAKRAVRILSASDPSSPIDVSKRFFDDLNQEAVIVALTETHTSMGLPLSGMRLRLRIRSRLKRELGNLRMRDYHYGEAVPDTDRLTADEQLSEMISPSTQNRFDMRDSEEIMSTESAVELRAGTIGDADAGPLDSTELNETPDLDLPLNPGALTEVAVSTTEQDGPTVQRVMDFGNLAADRLNETELIMVRATYEGQTGAEIAEGLGCHQSTVVRGLQNIGPRAKPLRRSRAREPVQPAPSTHFLPILDGSAC